MGKPHILDSFEKMEVLFESSSDNPFWFIYLNSLSEVGLRWLIKKEIKNPEYLDNIQLSTSQIIDLAVAVGAIEEVEAKTFKTMNKIRNSIAHTIDTNIENKVEELVRSFEGRIKSLHTHFSNGSKESRWITHSINQFLIKLFIKHMDNSLEEIHAKYANG